MIVMMNFLMMVMLAKMIMQALMIPMNLKMVMTKMMLISLFLSSIYTGGIDDGVYYNDVVH